MKPTAPLIRPPPAGDFLMPIATPRRASLASCLAALSLAREEKHFDAAAPMMLLRAAIILDAAYAGFTSDGSSPVSFPRKWLLLLRSPWQHG